MTDEQCDEHMQVSAHEAESREIPSFSPKINHLGSLCLDELCHLPSNQGARRYPHVSVAEPVLILGRPQFGSQSRTANAGGLINFLSDP